MALQGSEPRRPSHAPGRPAHDDDPRIPPPARSAAPLENRTHMPRLEYRGCRLLSVASAMIGSRERALRDPGHVRPSAPGTQRHRWPGGHARRQYRV